MRTEVKMTVLFLAILIITAIPLRLRADQADTLYKEGIELENSGQKDFAVFKYSTIIRSYPHSRWADAALFKLAEFYYENKDYFNSRQNFEKLITQYPKSSYVESSKQYIEAITNISKKNDLKSAVNKILSDIETMKTAQNWDEMLSECEKLSAFEHLSDEDQAKLVEYYKTCGDAFIKNELWDKAKTAYEGIMKITPGDTEALNQLYEINKAIKTTDK